MSLTKPELLDVRLGMRPPPFIRAPLEGGGKGNSGKKI